jgi:hypothetical protein
MSEHDIEIKATTEGWLILDLWSKYEDVAMHFNDLLIKLRTQALAAVAALTTIVGIFAKSGDATASWKLVAFAFAMLAIFWVAIWVIDFCYYNRLLIGAATALYALEELSKTKMRVSTIDLSTQITASVAGAVGKNPGNWPLEKGRWVFYTLVFAALLCGFLFSLCQFLKAT